MFAIFLLLCKSCLKCPLLVTDRAYVVPKIDITIYQGSTDCIYYLYCLIPEQETTVHDAYVSPANHLFSGVVSLQTTAILKRKANNMEKTALGWRPTLKGITIKETFMIPFEINIQTSTLI